MFCLGKVATAGKLLMLVERRGAVGQSASTFSHLSYSAMLENHFGYDV